MNLPPRPKRSSVFIDAALGSDESHAPMQRVRIRDLSEGGAKIEGKPPPIGTAVILSRGAVEIYARVVWAGDRHFGIAFDEPASLDLIMQAAQPRSPERPLHAAALTSGVGQTRSIQPRRRSMQPERMTFGLRVAS